MKVIAHRGGYAEAPENTLAAFALAVELGADGVEFDVQQTLDGELVVLHDATLDRTTNGHGVLSDAHWHEICELDAGSWFSHAFKDQRIPQLSDVFAFVGCEFEVELKGYGGSYLEAVLALTDSTGAYERIEFTSSNPLLLVRLKSVRPQARIGLLNRRPDPGMSARMFERQVVGTAETSGVDVVHVYAGAVTSGIVDRLHGLGLEAHAHDADSSDLVRRAIDSGADRLTTSDVRMAVEVRNAGG